jgi:hypothetical protein
MRCSRSDLAIGLAVPVGTLFSGERDKLLGIAKFLEQLL